ncbi:hypothetical protein K2X85_12210 [bacterium]|nr:hypothetical protein [bacterium]
MAGSPRSLVLGFVGVRRESSTTFRAGYLLVTDYGRPIEFHYTAPVTVPQSHQLLYGPDFEPIFFSESLAKPMTDRQSAAPHLIVVASPALLRLRQMIPAPVVYVFRVSPDGPWACQSHPEFAKDQGIFEKAASMVPPGFDWREIFERIDAALAETKETSPLLVA